MLDGASGLPNNLQKSHLGHMTIGQLIDGTIRTKTIVFLCENFDLERMI